MTGNKEKYKDIMSRGRSCRDVLWIFVFAIFWLGMYLLAAFAFSNGNPKRLLYGVDSFGNICGQNNAPVTGAPNSGLDMTSRRLLYYFTPDQSDSLRSCTELCPNVTCTGGGCTATDVCFNSPYVAASLILPDTACPSSQYESSDSLRIHRCIPADPSVLGSVYGQLSSLDTMSQVMGDFAREWQIIIFCVLIAAFVAITIIGLMWCCAGVVIWGLVLSGFFALVGLSFFLLTEYKSSASDDQSFSSYSDNTKMFLALMILSFICTLIVLVLIVSLRKRISICVAVFREASRALMRMPQVLFAPIITYVFLAAFFAYWIAVYLYLVTSGSPTADAATGHVEYVQSNENYRRMWWYHLFGLFWNASFILACGEFVIASSVVTWYFTRDKAALSSPVSSSIWRLLRYHMGSLIFGSFIIAVVQFVRYIIMRVHALTARKSNAAIRFILCCCACCLWCLENCLKFLAKNAYIEIAIHGASFCTAARMAFKTLLENVLRVAIINSVGTFVLFLCKLIVVALTVIIAMAWLQSKDDVHFWSLIVLVIGIFAYFIAELFLGIYKMTIDTIFLCFAEDCKHNNGLDRPYFMHANFYKFLSGSAPPSGNSAPNAPNAPNAANAKPPPQQPPQQPKPAQKPKPGQPLSPVTNRVGPAPAPALNSRGQK
eukprot:m.310639 g.310639  ORF g.310639 m.310639 type:complete len:659 (+) comp55355_c0_seq1:221-2197(+)